MAKSGSNKRTLRPGVPAPGWRHSAGGGYERIGAPAAVSDVGRNSFRYWLFDTFGIGARSESAVEVRQRERREAAEKAEREAINPFDTERSDILERAAEGEAEPIGALPTASQTQSVPPRHWVSSLAIVTVVAITLPSLFFILRWLLLLAGQDGSDPQ
jgi:hypothetical protein